MKNNRKKRRLRLIFGFVISLVSLVIIFRLINFNQVLTALRLADFRYVALLLCISLVWLGIRAVFWRTLLCEKATMSQVFLTLNVGYLLNNILPFRLGEVGRAFLLSKKAGLVFLQVIPTILIERALDLAIAVGLFLSTFALVVETKVSKQAPMIVGAIVLVGLLLLHLLARNQAWGLKIFEDLARQIPLILKILKPTQLEAFFSGLSALVDGKQFLKAIFWLVVNWFVAIIQFFILLKAFFPQPQLLWAAFTLSVTSLGIAVPSSPGAIGVLEISIVGALAAFKLDPAKSLAAALIAHLSNYLVTGLIGVFALTRDGLSLSGIFHEVSDIPTTIPPQELRS